MQLFFKKNDYAVHFSWTHQIYTIHSTKFKWLVFGINDNVDHNTYLSWNNVVCRIEEYAFFQVVLERSICTFDTWINHITGHHFQSLIQVLSKFLIRPMQVPDEGLKRIELPEQIFWSGTTVPEKSQIAESYLLCTYVCTFFHVKMNVDIAYPLISQRSFSNPLCIDWPIELSMRSTYRITWGAKVWRKCSWNFPFFKLSSVRK